MRGKSLHENRLDGGAASRNVDGGEKSSGGRVRPDENGVALGGTRQPMHLLAEAIRGIRHLEGCTVTRLAAGKSRLIKRAGGGAHACGVDKGTL
jgi:hypothetical protein